MMPAPPIWTLAAPLTKESVLFLAGTTAVGAATPGLEELGTEVAGLAGALEAGTLVAGMRVAGLVASGQTVTYEVTVAGGAQVSTLATECGTSGALE